MIGSLGLVNSITERPQLIIRTNALAIMGAGNIALSVNCRMVL